MEFKAIQTSYYTLDEKQIIKFKQAMLECYKKSYLDDKSECKHTINDISDKIIKEVIGDAVQEAFGYCDYFYEGMAVVVTSDPNICEITLDFNKEDIKNLVCVATENWVDEEMLY